MTMDNSEAKCPICNSASNYDFSSRDLMFEHYQRYDYFECPDCQSVFLNPMPSPEEVNSFYPEDYSVFDEASRIRKVSPLKQAILKTKHAYTHLKPGSSYELLAKLIAPLYRMDKPDYIDGGNLLDVGCGNGRYLNTMRFLGWQVQGVELSENGFKVCQTADLDVHHGDIFSAKFADDSFDVITVRHVIEHIREPHPFMAELARVLRPGGRLIIETPNSDALGRAYMGAKWYANDVPRHLILFAPDNLNRLAKEYGLKLKSNAFSTTPKIILNTIDYVTNNKEKPSNKVRWKRSLARVYVWLARYSQRGDTFHSIFTK